ncbi:Uncharacterized protein OBRU01_21646 [Operophtera brumata]|uniref:Uncharacterized protein n=1 Tax=Operophtera brumata TaxID=104452 RepID=A0A0L7KMJ9_OPEBR|nr:Uncharacterized protein OBRU01_21646 [Operophtera brumata]
MEDIKNSMSEMVKSFSLRMNQFETGLQKSAAPSSIAGLAADYADFKSFIMGLLRALQVQIEFMAKELDSLEMRGRRKILLLHGVAEQQKEDTTQEVVKTVVERLEQSGFVASDISRCHRMGRSAGTSDRPRPILFKLRDASVRSKIWSSKSSLKGSGITMSEFLTKARHDAFMAARQRFGISKCWTTDGTVYVLGADGARHRVRCVEDLDSVAPGVSQQVQVPKLAAGKETSRTRRAAASKMV